jgi:hypothetical protein
MAQYTFRRWPGFIFPPFPGFPPPEYLRKFEHLFEQWRDAQQLQEFSTRAATPNELLHASRTTFLSGGGILGLFASLIGINASPSRLPDFDIRGGMKVPHIHLDDKIYLLNDEQWRSLSTEVIKDFKTHLDAAHSLTLDQMESLGEARTTLAG